MLLSLFPDTYDDEWEKRRKYCVYKAGTILKAIKNGEEPFRGNPNDPENDGKRQIPKPKEERPATPDKNDGDNLNFEEEKASDLVSRP